MILGIDTSSVAGNSRIDWTAAKAAGLAYALLRSNFGDTTDASFALEWSRVRDAGLVRGAYLFLRFPNGGQAAPEPEAQARAMVQTLGDIQPSDLPPALDLEFPDGRGATGLTVAQCLDWVLRARGVLVDAFGVAPILYTSARVWRDDLGSSRATDLVDCPLWLARYYFKEGLPVRSGAAFGAMPAPPVPPPWGDDDNWWIHQYQGNASDFPGFSGKVDLDRFNPLYTGTGARVRWMQQRLGVTADGRIGDITRNALAAFQSSRGLVADRVVGPRTFAYLAWQKVT